MPVNNLIKFRNGIATEWSGQNPTLASGEPGYDGTNNLLKIGNGDDAWNDLNHIGLIADDLSTSLVGGTGIHLGYDSVTDQLSINMSGLLGSNLDLNNHNITGVGDINISGDITAISGVLDVLSFNVDSQSELLKGQITWDDTEGVVSMGLTDTLTTHIGEQRFYRVRNQTGSPLYKGQVVYATGVHSNGIITPAKYIANNTIQEVRFIGVVMETVNNNNNGYVADFGHIHEIDLRGNVASNYAVGNETWLAGDILYAHPTVSGKLTKVKPKHAITVAIILDNSSNGKMFVRPTTFGDLDDNHTVNTSGVTNGQFLQYNATTDYWIPSSSGNFTTLQLNGSGVLVKHPTISAASSVDNSNGTVIQDITLDSNGHVTALGSANLDSRYYTESEIDAFNYVDGGGTANYVAKWSDTDTLTSGIIYDDGTDVGIGTASPGYKLDVNGTFSANSINVNDAFTFPTADGSADQYLKTDGLGNVTWSTAAGGGISNVVEDTTPQLGGTLDLNGNNIEGYAFQTTPTGTIIGASGWIYQSGQQVLSNGSFGTHIGDAQFTQNILRAQTTDATLTNLTIGTQSGILLASNRTYNFTVNVVGRRTNGQDHAGYKLEGMLVNDGYGTQILGSPVKTTFYESDTSWDAQVAITGAGAGGTDYLLVRCQGATSKNINWVAHADMLEVGGNIDGYTEANILGLSSDTIP